MQSMTSNMNALFGQYLSKVIAQQETIDSLNQFTSEISVRTNTLPDFISELSGIAVLLGLVTAIISSLYSKIIVEPKVEKKKEKREAEYFQERDLISFLRYSLTQIEEYYVINKNQARNTYWASIIVSILGFLGLSTSILSWRNDVELMQAAVPIAGIAGSIVLEFIAYSILNIYRTTLQQLNSYFIQLVRLQELLLSIDLSNKLNADVQDENKKVIIKTLLDSYKKPLSLTTPDLILKARSQLEETDANKSNNLEDDRANDIPRNDVRERN